MDKQPPKRKRIVPIPVAPLEASGTTLDSACTEQAPASVRAPVEYQLRPSTLPGRRMKADISGNYIVDYTELLKQNGVNPKEAKARQAEPVAAKPSKPDGLPNLPGLPRAGASPGVGGKAMFGSVVDRLERIYAATYGGEDEDEDEDEEGESDGEPSDTSQAEASGDSGSKSVDLSDEEMADAPSSAKAELGPGGAVSSAAAAEGAAPGGGGGGDAAAGAAAAGAVTDGAGPKKPKPRRRPSVLAYEDDFIDDTDELQYVEKRRTKVKYQGFFVNQGAVEVENDPEVEEEQRQAQKRAPRARQPPGAQPSKAKAQAQAAQPGTQPNGAAATAAAGPAAGGGPGGSAGGAPEPAVATAATQPPGGASTPIRGGGKRRAEGDNPQPAGKKRKQPPPPEAAATGPQSPTPAGGAPPAAAAATTTATEAAASGRAAAAAPVGLAALAASLGRSAGTSAAAAAGAGASAAGGTGKAMAAAQPPSGAVPVPVPVPTEERPSGSNAQPAAETGAAASGPISPAAAAAGSAGGSTLRLPNLRHTPTSLDKLIADIRKKLGTTASPPADWGALLKLADSQLSNVALYLHKNHRDDTQAYEAGLAQVAAALAEAAPAIAGSGTAAATSTAGAPGSGSGPGTAVPRELRDFMQRRVAKGIKDLAKAVAAVKSRAADLAAADTAATAAAAGPGPSSAGAAAHSSDDEFTEPAGAAPSSAAAALLEDMDATIRKYLNLHHKVHNGDDDAAILQSLAAQVGVDIDVLQRALLSTQNRPTGQRKRQGSKTAAAAGTGPGADEVLRQQAEAIVSEANKAVAEGRGAAPALAGGAGGSGGAPAAPTVGATGTAAGAVAPAGPKAVAAAQPEGNAATAAKPTSAAPVGSHAAAGGAQPTGAEAANEGPSSQPEGTQAEPHRFPSAEEDNLQRQQCRAALRSIPGAVEEMLDRALEAAASSEWATAAIKTLCHVTEAQTVNELARHAERLHHICWPSHKAKSELHRQLKKALSRPSIAAHVLHVGDNKYVLQAARPDAKAVARPPTSRGPGAGAGGSGGSSPAAAAPPPKTATTAADGAPVPFPQLQPAPPAQEVAAAAAPAVAAAAPTAPAPRGSAAPEAGAAAAAPAAAAAGGDVGGGAGASAPLEEELTPEEDHQQCMECVEAAAQAGADRQRVQDVLLKLKPCILRIVFKVLCHAGPAGMRVPDIVTFARDHRFAHWRSTKEQKGSVHNAIRASKDMLVHVGSHQYALSLFPGVVSVPKPDKGRGARGAGGGGAAGAAAVEGAGDEGGEM